VIKLKKDFVEPEIVKYEQSLDKVTLHINGNSGGGSSGGGSECKPD